ncbi:MAG TPA: SAM-dependent methyltransferase [Pyrinomonadaceae bacterium]|nr:SAM-dependent methyltransferase [Pyrinomonadaceae bacterium]
MSARDEASSELPLAERLRERIRRDGPLSFRDWMAAALYDEPEGYYVRRDRMRWGRAGDYRTAPERSPLFGATFAHFFARLYEELNGPRDWAILESGAGAGHFAHSVLSALQRDYPLVFSATHYAIEELSADARDRARERLSEFAERVEFLHPAETKECSSEGIIFANELLDAFPVHRVTLRDGKLLELFVSLDEGGGFAWTEREPSAPQLAEYFNGAGVELSEGQIAEVNLGVEEWMSRAASKFKRAFIIIVDYGAEASDLYTAPHRRQGTLRAFHRHRFADELLAMPGEQDITTTIDWTNVRRIGEALGLQSVSFERQDEFLMRAGLLEQLERMTSEATNETEALVLRSGVRELILPGGMSDSFQVMIFKKDERPGALYRYI